MSTHRLSHPRLGLVSITERRGSRKLSARWINGELHVNIPAGISLEAMRAAIERHVNDFESMRPQPRYRIGQTISCHDFTISIVESTTHQEKAEVYLASKDISHPAFAISIPQSRPVNSPEIQQIISRAIHLAGRRLAENILIPRGRQLAGKFRLKVDSWEIAHGKTTLGTCFPRQRRIRLSYMCVFLDPELRDYIICHELAHLTEPGHTSAFHRLCDYYCDGKEKILISRLHSYRWPVDR